MTVGWWECGCMAMASQGRRAVGPAAPSLELRARTGAAGTVLQQRIRFGAGEPERCFEVS